MSKLMRTDWQPVAFPPAPDIDAHITAGGARIALDHTALNSFEAQRLSDARFSAIAKPLSDRLTPPDAGIAIRFLFPAKGLPKVSEEKVRDSWVPQLNRLVPDVPLKAKWSKITLDNPQCEVWIEKSLSKYGGIYFARSLHQESADELKEDLCRALESKNLQLTSSKRAGCYTILLIESTDISTINEVIVGEAFGVAYKQAPHDALDAVFLFDDGLRDGQSHMVWPLKYKGVIPPDWVWMDEFRRAQSVLVWGFKDRGEPFVQT